MPLSIGRIESLHSNKSHFDYSITNNLTGVLFNNYSLTEYENATGNISTGHRRNEALARIEVGVQAAIFCMAILGNGVVLLVLSTQGKKLSRMNLLIFHLSLADIFVALFNVLPQLIWDITFTFQGGDILCRLVKYFQVVAMYASSYVLITTAIDRYLVICHPLRTHSWTNKKVQIMVLSAWIASLLLSAPQVFIFAQREIKPGVYDCWGDFNPIWTGTLYSMWFFFALYIIPLIILGIAYGCICYAVWQSTMAKEPSVRVRSLKNGSVITNYKRVATGSDDHKVTSKPRAHVQSMSRSKMKTVKLTLTVIACYFICWTPFFITQMWSTLDDKAPNEGSAMVIFFLLASLNSCTNPWIYLVFSDNLCQYLSRCVGRRRKRRFDSTLSCTDSRFRTNVKTEVIRLDSDPTKCYPLIALQDRASPDLIENLDKV